MQFQLNKILKNFNNEGWKEKQFTIDYKGIEYFFLTDYNEFIEDIIPIFLECCRQLPKTSVSKSIEFDLTLPQ